MGIKKLVERNIHRRFPHFIFADVHAGYIITYRTAFVKCLLGGTVYDVFTPSRVD